MLSLHVFVLELEKVPDLDIITVGHICNYHTFWAVVSNCLIRLNAKSQALLPHFWMSPCSSARFRDKTMHHRVSVVK